MAHNLHLQRRQCTGLSGIVCFRRRDSCRESIVGAGIGCLALSRRSTVHFLCSRSGRRFCGHARVGRQSGFGRNIQQSGRDGRTALADVVGRPVQLSGHWYFESEKIRKRTPAYGEDNPFCPACGLLVRDVRCAGDGLVSGLGNGTVSTHHDGFCGLVFDVPDPVVPAFPL